LGGKADRRRKGVGRREKKAREKTRRASRRSGGGAKPARLVVCGKTEKDRPQDVQKSTPSSEGKGLWFGKDKVELESGRGAPSFVWGTKTFQKMRGQ